MPVYASRVKLQLKKYLFPLALYFRRWKIFRPFHLSAHRTRLLKNFVRVCMLCCVFRLHTHFINADAADLKHLVLLLYNMKEEKSDLCDFINNIAIFFFWKCAEISTSAQSTAKWSAFYG